MNVVAHLVEQAFDIAVQHFKKRCPMTLPRYLKKHSEYLRGIRQSRRHITSDDVVIGRPGPTALKRIREILADQTSKPTD
jgi:hypothetical protein